MNANIANVALQFLKRVNLNAEEINAFQAVQAALSQVINQEQNQTGGDEPCEGSEAEA